ncbi:MAG: hemerythrin domain-containing protein [Azoarcus sp.]|nr:hemerythrin domain-containing protein [Azoarcus sp.]
MKGRGADSLLGAPAPGLDEPLEMLSACHERVHARIETLERLARWLPEHGADEQARQAATAVLRYFDQAAVNHHLDEERDLFPAMRACVAPAEASRLAALETRILDDHRALAARWAVMREPLLAIAAGESVELREEAVATFRTVYSEHIALEEAEVLPWAARVLGEAELAAMSTAMTGRRREPGGPPD